MKTSGIVVVLIVVAVFVLQGVCWADPTTTPTVRIRLQGSAQYVPGRSMTFTVECPCGSTCGSDTQRDNLFIHRLVQGWDHSGGWFCLGGLPHNAASQTFTFNIPRNWQQADDYVITAWWGDSSCWGRSERFMIAKPGFRQGDPGVLIWDHKGFWRQEKTVIRWNRPMDTWERVKVELLRRNIVVQVLAEETRSFINWTVGTTCATPTSVTDCNGVLSSYADDNGFQIRITDLDTGQTDTSDHFAIKTPKIEFVEPTAARFRSGERMTIGWKSEGLPGAQARLFVQFCRPGGACDNKGYSALSPACMKAFRSTLYRGGHVIDEGGFPLEGSRTFTVPEPGSFGWPRRDCYPITARVVLHWWFYFGFSRTFTIEE